MRVGAVLIVLILAWAGVCVARADADTGTITLSRGWNVVTWNGAEPYAIDNFADTPVTGVHRWDAASGQWLSRFVGRDGGSLPELHLLPRVQYLLIAEARHELDVPDAVAGVDPRAALRRAAPPDDPLRFDAYWPNEDSPLEDLVVLRGEDQRLSVRAEVAGGVGQVEVYWLLDGRLNHQELASDDVELTPGKHDNARLHAVDATGQVASVELPRVVKLPRVEIPQMIYGVNEWYLSSLIGDCPSRICHQYMSIDEIELVVDSIASLGTTHVRFDLPMWLLFSGSNLAPSSHLSHMDFVMQTILDAGLEPTPIVGQAISTWALAQDVSKWSQYGGSLRDLRFSEELGRAAARRWPKVRYFMVQNEAQFVGKIHGLDPVHEAMHEKAVALGIWYENPDAVIAATSLCCWFEGVSDDRASGFAMLEGLYKSGYGRWNDIVALNYPGSAELDLIREIMVRYGDGAKPIWITETGNWWEDLSETAKVDYYLRRLELYTERVDVTGLFLWKFRDTPDGLYPDYSYEHLSGLVAWELQDGQIVPQAPYWAVRDWLRAQREKQAANE